MRILIICFILACLSLIGCDNYQVVRKLNTCDSLCNEEENPCTISKFRECEYKNSGKWGYVCIDGSTYLIISDSVRGGYPRGVTGPLGKCGGN